MMLGVCGVRAWTMAETESSREINGTRFFWRILVTGFGGRWFEVFWLWRFFGEEVVEMLCVQVVWELFWLALQ